MIGRSTFITRSATGLSLLGGLVLVLQGPVWLFLFILTAMWVYLIIAELPRLFTTFSLSYIAAASLILISFVLLGGLHLDPLYRPLVPLLIAFTTLNDTFAYCGGSLWGTRKLWPAISPGKTWEGFFSGVLALELFGLIFIRWQGTQPHAWYLYLVSVAVVATAGDLFESWLKRRAGLKDSGSLLPGHGGLLDRIDSLVAIAIFGYVTRHYLLSWI